MRKLSYLALATLCVAVVVIKARYIEKKANTAIVSTLSVWEQNGKPVDAYTVRPLTLHAFATASGVVRNNGMVEAKVTADIASTLKEGQLFVSHLNGITLQGYIERVSSQRNNLTGMYDVVLWITRPKTIAPGTNIIAQVTIETISGALAIPTECVVTTGKKAFCWVIKDSRAQQRPLIIGKTYDGHVAVHAGLKNGDVICASGLSVLQDNDRVLVRANASGRGVHP